MKRKILTLLLSICTLSTLVACGEAPETNITENDVSINNETSIETNTDENIETPKFTESDFRFETSGIIYDFDSIPDNFWTAQNKEDEELTNAEYVSKQIWGSDFTEYPFESDIRNYKLNFLNETSKHIIGPSSYNLVDSTYTFEITPTEYLFNLNDRFSEQTYNVAGFVGTDLEVYFINYDIEKLNYKPKEEQIQNFEPYKTINGWDIYVSKYEMEDSDPVLYQFKLYREVNETDKTGIWLECEKMPFTTITQADKLLDAIANYITITEIPDEDLGLNVNTETIYTGKTNFKLNDKISLNFDKVEIEDCVFVGGLAYKYKLENKDNYSRFDVDEIGTNKNEYINSLSGDYLKDIVEDFKEINMYEMYRNEEFWGVLFEADGHVYTIRKDSSSTIDKTAFINMLKDIVIIN